MRKKGSPTQFGAGDELIGAIRSNGFESFPSGDLVFGATVVDVALDTTLIPSERVHHYRSSSPSQAK
jgi:hypothetical protein